MPFSFALPHDSGRSSGVGYRAMPVVLTAYALIGGLLSLAGWVADVQRLTDWEASGLSIQPNAAVATICAAAALAFLRMRQAAIAAALGILVALIGATSLFQHLTQIHLEPINALLLFDRPWGSNGTANPGLMGPPGSTCWTLIGAALVLMAHGGRMRRAVPPIALLPLAIATLSIVGYLFRSDPLYALPHLTAIALQTASFVLALSLAIIASVPERPPMLWLLDRGSAGILARVTTPLAILTPVLVCALVALGQQAGWYDVNFGAAMVVFASIAMALTLMSWSLRTVARHEGALRDAQRRSKAMLESISDGFVAIDSAWRYTYVNREAARIMGKQPSELLGRVVWEVFPDVAGTAVQTALERAAAGSSEEFEAFNPAMRRWFANKAYPQQGGGVTVYFQDITESKRAAQESAADLDAMARLQALSVRLVQSGERDALLREILSAAADLTGTDKGNIQLYDPGSGRLRIVVHQGLGPRLIEHFAEAGWVATCEAAAEEHARVIVEDVATLDQSASTKELEIVLEDGIRAIQSTPMLSRDGRRLLGMLNNHYRKPHRPSEQELRYLDLLARMAADFVERSQAEEALEANRRELEAELRASQRLHEIAARMVEANDFPRLLDEILGAAISITGADMGNVQLMTGSALKLVAQRGFDTTFLEFFDTVDDAQCACGAALEERQRMIVTDVAASPLYSSEARATMLAADARAVQSTPLVGRAGRLLGMFSTHYREAGRQPSEQALRSLDLLARLAADLIEARSDEQALRAADRRKDAFLATLAHELRGPLAPISNALEVLNRAPDDRAAAHWARQVMQRQLSHMVRLVDDLLDLSRITQDKIELRREPVALRGIIEQAIEGCRPLLDAGRHTLVVAFPDQEVHVHADTVRLVQVFNNLIHNSCKFSDPEGEIRIAADRAGTDVTIRVRDSGCGIAPGALETVFDLFSQAAPSAGSTESGLGIGLYLVRRLVQLHDGTVVATSAGAGQGSEFVVRLPVIRACSLVSRAAPTDANRSSSCRILVVDDNVDSANSLAMLLKISGNDVYTAHDPHAALEAAEEVRPDCVLLDIGLPGMSGHDVCRILRTKSWGRSVLVVAVSGWGQEEDRRRSRDAGFNHHLVKPVDCQALLALVSSLRTVRDLPAAAASESAAAPAMQMPLR